MVYNRYDDSFAVKIIAWLSCILIFVALYFCLANYRLASRYSPEGSLIALSYGHAWLLTCISAGVFMTLWRNFAGKILLRAHTGHIIQRELTGHVTSYEVKGNNSIKKYVEYEWQGHKFTLPVMAEDVGVFELNERVTSLVELRLAPDGRLLGAKIIP